MVAVVCEEAREDLIGLPRTLALHQDNNSKIHLDRIHYIQMAQSYPLYQAPQQLSMEHFLKGLRVEEEDVVWVVEEDADIKTQIVV
jgi:hypothetical protein